MIFPGSPEVTVVKELDRGMSDNMHVCIDRSLWNEKKCIQEELYKTFVESKTLNQLKRYMPEIFSFFYVPKRAQILYFEAAFFLEYWF